MADSAHTDEVLLIEADKHPHSSASAGLLEPHMRGVVVVINPGGCWLLLLAAPALAPRWCARQKRA